MIAIHVVKDRGIRQLADTISKNILTDWVEFEDVSDQDREKLYQNCWTIDFGRKVVVTILEGSSIQDAASVLKNYKLEAEVGPSTYFKKGS
jgi:hypothetical protein